MVRGLIDLCQIPIPVVFPFVSHLVQRDPGIVTEVYERGWVRIGRKQRAVGRRPELGHHHFYRSVIVACGDRILVNVEMDRAEYHVVGLITRPHVLDIPSIRVRPGVIFLPYLSGVAPRNLNERNEALLVQVVNLPVQIMEVGGINTIHIWKDFFKPRHLSRKKERPAAFILHILRALGSILGPRRAHARTLGVIHEQFDGISVRGPGWKCRNDEDGVVALSLAVTHIVLETGLWAQRMLLIIVFPEKSIGAGGIPGVTNYKEWRTIGLLDGVTIGSGPQKSASQRIFIFLFLAPGDRIEFTVLAGQSGVRGIRAALPSPFARRGSKEPHAKCSLPIPEPINLFAKIGAFQVHPDDYIGVRIRPSLCRRKGHLLLLPNVDGRSGGEADVCKVV